MFEKLSDKPVAEVQNEQVKEWNDEDLLGKCVSEREGKPSFIFYEGPPTANGKPGIHHVMARTLKDSVCRYKTMKGFQVNRKAGWDTHGLPVEIEVEKQLGMENNVFAILDTTLTPELVAEGLAREIISKVQQLRKQNDFEMMDNINIYVHADAEVLGAVSQYEDYIKKETLAKTIEEAIELPEFDINGHKTGISVERI